MGIFITFLVKYVFWYVLANFLSKKISIFQVRGSKIKIRICSVHTWPLGSLNGRRPGLSLPFQMAFFYHFFGQLCFLICLGKSFIETEFDFLLPNLFILSFLLGPLCLFWKCCTKTMAKLAILMRRQILKLWDFISAKVCEGKLIIFWILRLHTFIIY